MAAQEPSKNEKEPLSEQQAEQEAYGEEPPQTEESGEAVIDEDLDKEEEVSPAEEGTSVGGPSNPELATGDLGLKQASELVKEKLAEALDKPANATISIEDAGDYWLATVEIVEEEYLPGQNLKSMNDLLGVYEAQLSHEGALLKWKRKGSYKRAEIK